MRNRWQPGRPGSLPDPGPAPRPTLRTRRNRRRGLQIFQLVAALGAGVLVALLTTTDHLSLRPSGSVGQAPATGQAATGQAPNVTASQAAPTATPPPAVPAGMPTTFDGALAAPTGLKTLGLNSTVRANWTPATGSSVAWQL